MIHSTNAYFFAYLNVMKYFYDDDYVLNEFEVKNLDVNLIVVFEVVEHLVAVDDAVVEVEVLQLL